MRREPHTYLLSRRHRHRRQRWERLTRRLRRAARLRLRRTGAVVAVAALLRLLTFSTATITARGALIYNEAATSDPSVCVLDFGGDKTSTNGDFTIQFPAADASNAIIRIA